MLCSRGIDQARNGASVGGVFQTTLLPVVGAQHQAFIQAQGAEVRFVISSIADFNRDGVVTSDDLFNFLDDFFEGEIDFNGDGVVNSQDFFDYLAEFFR